MTNSVFFQELKDVQKNLMTLVVRDPQKVSTVLEQATYKIKAVSQQLKEYRRFVSFFLGGLDVLAEKIKIGAITLEEIADSLRDGIKVASIDLDIEPEKITDDSLNRYLTEISRKYKYLDGDLECFDVSNFASWLKTREALKKAEEKYFDDWLREQMENGKSLPPITTDTDE